MVALLAHQGGWDEAALFVVPAVLAFLAIRWAERRAKRRGDATATPTGTSAAPLRTLPARRRGADP